MEIVFERIHKADFRFLKELSSLYVASFPPEERRELSALWEMLDEPQMSLTALLQANQFIGFLIYWKFEEFLYIEHLAISPKHQGKGIGTDVLRWIQNMDDCVLLEVEIPYDSASSRRVSFYNRCGFHSLPINYFQPPYREGESLLPMMLFSDRTDWQEESLNKAIELFHYQVYQYKSK